MPIDIDVVDPTSPTFDADVVAWHAVYVAAACYGRPTTSNPWSLAQMRATVVWNAREEDVVVTALDHVDRVDLHVAQVLDGGPNRVGAGPKWFRFRKAWIPR